jgi:EAL domain-containing protein (putative c-di-GMP-specific phosphodiesterase class I)
LSESNVPPSRLEIEITEHAVVTEIDAAREMLASLKRLGARTALDDFGVRYSSLRNLKELSVDALKIDKSFVQSLEDSEDGRAIVKAIIQMAKTLGLAVTAEGIETASQAAALLALGCERGQGFYLGRPSPLPLARADQREGLAGQAEAIAAV